MSHHNRSKRKARTLNDKRSDAVFGEKSYRDGLQRAFNNAKLQIYFNPDMQYFVTLTYKGIEADYKKVQDDIKVFAKRERRNGNINFKYIYVLEWQKRGSLHVHMITNKIATYTNQNGFQSVKYWRNGVITSALHVKDFDNNFKPYLYLFKYMKKAQRIGKSFIHSSRNLNNYEDISKKQLNYIDWKVVNQEVTKAKLSTGEKRTLNFYKYYLSYDILPDNKERYEQLKDFSKWQQVLLQSTREKVKKETILQH